MKLVTNKLDIEKCVKNVGNKFDLILIAAARTREITRKKIVGDHKPTVQALIDAEQGLVGREMLRRVRAR